MNSEFQPLNPKYRKAQLVGVALAYVLLMALALLLLLTDTTWPCVIVEIILALAMIVNLAIVPKAFLAKGFALREHDITYRKGIIFPKITTVPFSKIQQVSLEQNPVTKCLKLYQLKIVNGAQSLSSLNIPGLEADTAQWLKDSVMAKMLKEND